VLVSRPKIVMVRSAGLRWKNGEIIEGERGYDNDITTCTCVTILTTRLLSDYE